MNPYCDKSPDELVSILRSSDCTTQLTFAAEAIGAIENKELALSVLSPLAMHESPLVREGVIYGLEIIGTPEAKVLLRKIAFYDRLCGLKIISVLALSSIETIELSGQFAK